MKREILPTLNETTVKKVPLAKTGAARPLKLNRNNALTVWVEITWEFSIACVWCYNRMSGWSERTLVRRVSNKKDNSQMIGEKSRWKSLDIQCYTKTQTTTENHKTLSKLERHKWDKYGRLRFTVWCVKRMRASLELFDKFSKGIIPE